MGRAASCEKLGVKRGRWTAEEDQILTNYIQLHGEGSWRSLPKNAGLLRCGKSCRLRWINYLRPDLKRGNVSAYEEEAIVKLHAALGNRWSLIAAHLPGRTDHEIKNYWNSHLSRKIYSFTKLQGTQYLPTILNVGKKMIPSSCNKSKNENSLAPPAPISSAEETSAHPTATNFNLGQVGVADPWAPGKNEVEGIRMLGVESSCCLVSREGIGGSAALCGESNNKNNNRRNGEKEVLGPCGCVGKEIIIPESGVLVDPSGDIGFKEERTKE